MKPKFLKVALDVDNNRLENVLLFPEIVELLKANHDKLFDDYCGFTDDNAPQKVMELINKTTPCFWAVIDRDTDEFAGVIFLDNWIGAIGAVHSACVTTCFRKKFWGKFVKRAGRMFTRYVFRRCGLKKLKAEVFASNSLARGVLDSLGFRFEALLCRETLVSGVPQDLALFALFPPGA